MILKALKVERDPTLSLQNQGMKALTWYLCLPLDQASLRIKWLLSRERYKKGPIRLVINSQSKMLNWWQASIDHQMNLNLIHTGRRTAQHHQTSSSTSRSYPEPCLFSRAKLHPTPPSELLHSNVQTSRLTKDSFPRSEKLSLINKT